MGTEFKACSNCRNALTLNINPLGFECQTCGERSTAKDEDTLLMTLNHQEMGGASDRMDKYSTHLSVSAYDPTGMKVKRNCPKCKNKIMSLARIGENQIVYYTCTCGFIETGITNKF